MGFYRLFAETSLKESNRDPVRAGKYVAVLSMKSSYAK